MLRLRLWRWRNQAVDAMGKLSSSKLRASAGSRPSLASTRTLLGAAFWVVGLIGAFSYQSLRLFEQIALEAGPAGLQARAEWMLLLLTTSVAMADAERPAPSRQRRQEIDWLLSLPAPWWLLQTAKFVEAALLNPAALAFLLPFLIGLALHTDAGLTASLLACVLWIPLTAIGTLLRWLFQALAQMYVPDRLRSAGKILFNGAGLVIVIGYLVLPALPSAQLSASIGLSLPSVGWLPFSEPVRVLLSVGSSSDRVLTPLGWFLAEFVGVLLAGIAGLHWTYGRILPTAGAGANPTLEAPQGKRASRRQHRLGVWAKDSLRLLRQPDKLVSVLLAAVLVNAAGIVVPQRVAAPALTPAVLGGIVFAVGLAMLGMLSKLVDTDARAGLRLLATLPRSLAQIYARKSLLLALIASIAALPVVGHGIQRLGMTVAVVPPLAAAFAGIVLHAFVASALVLRSVRPDATASALEAVLRVCKLSLLGVGFCAGFAFQSQLTLLAWLVLCSALGFSFWQDSLASAARALDPWTPLPRTLTPTHGIVAVLALRVLQVGLGERLSATNVDPWLVPTLSFALAASLTLLGLVLLMRHWAIPPWYQAPGSRCAGWPSVVREALIWSVPALLAALGTLWAAAHWPWLQQSLREGARFPALAPSGVQLPIVLATVVLIPVVEELLFRGVIYGRARSALSVRASLLLSAAVFTAVHPPSAALPIFCLGACTALAYERSRSLLSPILVHASYNALLVSMVLMT